MVSLMRTLFGWIIGGLVAALVGLLSRLHVGHALGARAVTRRGFVRNAALGAVLIVLAEIGGGFVKLLWPNKTGAFGKPIAVAKTNVPAAGEKPFQDVQGKFYVVHNDDGLLALYWTCPHLGCTVPWVEAEQRFHCPCHGSIYDGKTGVRTGGPAPRGMDVMPIQVQPSGDIVVNTGAISERANDYSPSMATKYPA